MKNTLPKSFKKQRALTAAAALLLTAGAATAQTGVGIGTTTPNASAALDITSTNKGFLAPRVALTANNVAAPVTTPAAGLMVYNTATTGTAPNNVTPGYYVWNGTQWSKFNTSAATGNDKNIYEGDGTITTNRVVTYAGNTLSFAGSVGTFTFNPEGNRFNSNASELVLSQSGDVFGGTSLRLRNRNGENGLRVACDTVANAPDVTDVVIATKNAQRNVRLESRPTFKYLGDTASEMQLGRPNDPTLVIGNTTTLSKNENGGLFVDAGFFSRLGMVKKLGQDPVIAAGSATDLLLGHWSTGSIIGNISTGTFTSNLALRANGNVGIGTSAPNHKLEVSGNLVVTDTINGATTGGGVYFGNLNHGIMRGLTGSNSISNNQPGNDNDVAIFTSYGGGSGSKLHLVNNMTGGGNKNLPLGQFTLDGNGNVGIGTSTPAYKLDVVNPTITPNPVVAKFSTPNQPAKSVSYLKFGKNESTGNLADISYYYNGSSNDTNALRLGFQNIGPVLTATANGKVGIGLGETQPNITLDVRAIGLNDGIGFRNASVGAGTWDHIYMTHDATTAYLRAGGAEGGLAFQVGTGASGSYNQQTYTDVMRLGVDGTVTIKPVNATPVLITNGHLGTNPRVYSTDTLEFQSNANPYQLVLNPSGNVGMGITAPAYKLDVAGDINASGSIRANGVALTSDARLKRNVTTTAYGLATVMQLHPVQYEKKASMESTNYDRKEIGFIAQEVRKVLPTLVTEGKDASKTLAVSYTEIIPVLVKAMQEQEAKIELLEAQNAKLTAATAEMAEMKTAMAEMRSEMNRLVLNKVAGKKVAKK